MKNNLSSCIFIPTRSQDSFIALSCFSYPSEDRRKTETSKPKQEEQRFSREHSRDLLNLNNLLETEKLDSHAITWKTKTLIKNITLHQYSARNWLT